MKQIKAIKSMKKSTVSLISLLLISACANQPKEAVKLDDSYLKSENLTEVTNAELLTNNFGSDELTAEQQNELRFVPPFKVKTDQSVSAKDVLSQFSEQASLTISADTLPLASYLHQVLGEELKLNYILSDDVKNDKKSVTLNLQDPVSPKKLFTLTEEVLVQRGYVIRFDDNIFYIHKNTAKGKKGDVVYGYGKYAEDVPETSLDIIQMVPFDYGMQTSAGMSLKLLLGVIVYPDRARNNIIIK
jgi:general secretion pathway protein D